MSEKTLVGIFYWYLAGLMIRNVSSYSKPAPNKTLCMPLWAYAQFQTDLGFLTAPKMAL